MIAHMLVELMPEFRTVIEPEARAALADPDPNNPIAREVARLVAGYASNFQAHVERLGRVPADVLRVAPRWPIEAVAMELSTTTIREAMRQP